MYLDDWQKEVIADQSRYILLCKGRQIGGTSVLAEKAVKWMVEKNSRILVGSITEDQAKLVIVMVYSILYERHRKLIKGKATQDRIVLKNGAEIRSRPVGTMGDAFRGFTADVNWFNEASKWPELAFVSIMPTLMTTGGEIWMDSTPFGKKGFFHKCFENKEKLWKVYYKSSEDVIYNRPLNDYWTEDKRARAIKFLNDQKKEMSALQYGQEYMGLFLEDLNNFFDEKVVRAAMRVPKNNAITGTSYMGSDLARMGGDQIAHVNVIDDKSKIFKQTACVTFTKQLTTTTEKQIIQYATIWNSRKVGIDAEAGTLGVGILDHLRETEIRHKVVPMNNRKILIERKDGKEVYQRMAQEDMADTLRAMLEHGELWLLDDEEVYYSLMSVQMEVVLQNDVPTGIRIFCSPHSRSHIFEALKRAAYLAKKEKGLSLWCAY